MRKGKIFIGIAAVIVICFVAYQCYASLYNPISTEIVTQYEMVDGIDVTGVLIRDETLIQKSGNGTIHFEVSDSERVAKDGVIASIYSNQSQSIAATRMDEVQSEIDNIKEIEKYNNLEATDINLINSKIYENLNEIITASNTGYYGGLEANREELLNLINRKQIATGEKVDFTSQLATLEAELASLKTQAGSPQSKITTSKSGYFMSVSDGYETVLKTDNLSAITPEFLDKLKPVQVDEKSTLGKIVADYKWYIAADVSINDSLSFKEGDRLKVKTFLKSNREINVTVDRINMSEDQDRATIILCCQEMSAELSSMRTGAMTIIKHTYEGLKVNSKALRTKNVEVTDQNGETKTVSQTGVYVLSGMSVEFVPVDIIYSNEKEGIVICRQESENGKLMLYDEIIVKGKNMYDGKIID